MAEDVKNTESIDETVTETVETQDNKTNSKTFNQDEVNRLVQDRVKREKNVLAQSKAEWETRESELQGQVETYEKMIGKMIESQIASLDVTTQKLLKKLSLVDQIEFLSDESNLSPVSKKTIPTTPAAKTASEPDQKASGNKKTLNPFRI